MSLSHDRSATYDDLLLIFYRWKRRKNGCSSIHFQYNAPRTFAPRFGLTVKVRKYDKSSGKEGTSLQKRSCVARARCRAISQFYLYIYAFIHKWNEPHQPLPFQPQLGFTLLSVVRWGGGEIVRERRMASRAGPSGRLSRELGSS